MKFSTLNQVLSITDNRCFNLHEDKEMVYEAPDFIKVVANVKNSFTDSGPCTYSVGFLQVAGQLLDNGYHCGDSTAWIDTAFEMNCWIDDVE